MVWVAIAVDPTFVIAHDLVFVLLLEMSAHKLCHVAAALTVPSLTVARVGEALESFLGVMALASLNNRLQATKGPWTLVQVVLTELVLDLGARLVWVIHLVHLGCLERSFARRLQALAVLILVGRGREAEFASIKDVFVFAVWSSHCEVVAKRSAV